VNLWRKKKTASRRKKKRKEKKVSLPTGAEGKRRGTFPNRDRRLNSCPRVGGPDKKVLGAKEGNAVGQAENGEGGSLTQKKGGSWMTPKVKKAKAKKGGQSKNAEGKAWGWLFNPSLRTSNRHQKLTSWGGNHVKEGDAFETCNTKKGGE